MGDDTSCQPEAASTVFKVPFSTRHSALLHLGSCNCYNSSPHPVSERPGIHCGAGGGGGWWGYTLMNPGGIKPYLCLPPEYLPQKCTGSGREWDAPTAGRTELEPEESVALNARCPFPVFTEET